ncbi:MAG: radical SAM protein [Bacteroidales bacterium]|nr:radical SAM protein [Bacteroidales bacterium]
MQKKTLILFFPVFDYGYKGSEYLPFSILQLERAVRHLNINIILIDENTTANFEDVIIQYKESLFLAAVSAITGFQIRGGIDFSNAVRKHAPHAKIVWGGWHPTIVPEQTLKEDYIDFIIRAQGEKSFKELSEALLQENNFENINNLGYKKDGHLVLNPLNDFCNINDFPDVDYSLLDINKYVMKTDFSERRMMYFASYGCPFNCPFCSGAQIFQKKWFPKKIDTVINDIKYFINVSGIDSIMFWDDNFFSNKKFVLELAQRMIDEKLNMIWAASAHAGGFLKMFNEEEIKFLRTSGLRRIDTGAESGSTYALNIIKDKLNKKDVLNLIKTLKKNNIATFFSTMIAYPFPKSDDIKFTMDLIRKAKIIDDSVKIQINIYTPYPQTSLYGMAINEGFEHPQQLSDWINHSPARFKPPWLSKAFYTKLNDLMNFYLPFSENRIYERAPEKFKKTTHLFSIICRPLIVLRFRLNFFGLRFEAKIFNFFLKKFNKKNNSNFKFYSYGVFGV